VIGSEEEESVLEKIVRAIRELRPQTIITFGPDGLYGHEDLIAKSGKKRRSPLEMNCPK
jgi:LmbE family N-acetylglucosaminyl deacetylase